MSETSLRKASAAPKNTNERPRPRPGDWRFPQLMNMLQWPSMIVQRKKEAMELTATLRADDGMPRRRRNGSPRLTRLSGRNTSRRSARARRNCQQRRSSHADDRDDCPRPMRSRIDTVVRGGVGCRACRSAARRRCSPRWSRLEPRIRRVRRCDGAAPATVATVVARRLGLRPPRRAALTAFAAL